MRLFLKALSAQQFNGLQKLNIVNVVGPLKPAGDRGGKSINHMLVDFYFPLNCDAGVSNLFLHATPIPNLKAAKTLKNG